MVKWQTESSSIDKNIIDDLLYKNNEIDNFLDNENINFIVAGKGLGKTLAIQQKRLIFENKYNSAMFIPTDTPYVDVIDDFRVLPKTIIKAFRDHEFGKRFWIFILKISFISFHNEDKSFKIDEFAQTDIHKLSPSVIILFLLNMTKGNIEKLLIKYQPIVSHIFRTKVKSKTFLFIDRLDQSLYGNVKNNLVDTGKDFWVNMQTSLMHAAWEIMQINNHAKIYITIRQEAFANSSFREDLAAMEASIVNFKYSGKELMKILDKLSLKYENKNFYDFIGFREIDNSFYNIKENVFYYMKRHSLGRPRDLVYMCNNISSESEFNVDKFKGIINRASAELVRNYFAAQLPFLNLFRDDEQRNNFFKLIHTNILTKDELLNICEKFNNVDCNKECSSCDFHHPFCTLYNIGLLGILKEENIYDDNRNQVQKFLNPSEITILRNHILPESELYLIHPSLEEIIKDAKRTNGVSKNYRITKSLMVGDNLEWDNKIIKNIMIFKSVVAMENIFGKGLNREEVIKILEEIILLDEEGNTSNIKNNLKDRLVELITPDKIDKIINVISNLSNMWG